jgi:hypothetical protein
MKSARGETMDTYHVALVSDTQAVSFSDIANVSAALQKQVARDFGPLWDVNATVDAFQNLEAVPVDYWPVIVKDDINQPGAAGYHTDNNGQPFSLVQADGTWALTASHECLEMLADPFGNRTIAGVPPPQATGKPKKLPRVLYLVEVCDPCEDDSFSYQANGVGVSDFITPHYYDPAVSPSIQYSFGGNIKSPHQVLKNGYVSFGDPTTNIWYQVVVQNGKASTRSLGVMNTSGKSLRETVDKKVRELTKGYRTGKLAAARTLTGIAGDAGMREACAGRAKALRSHIKKLMKG